MAQTDRGAQPATVRGYQAGDEASLLAVWNAALWADPINPVTWRAKVLLDVPAYNFDDQGARELAAPVAVKKGDTLRVTCTYDATLRQKLPELKPLKPRYVLWGEGTSDEMCLGVVLYTAAQSTG